MLVTCETTSENSAPPESVRGYPTSTVFGTCTGARLSRHLTIVGDCFLRCNQNNRDDDIKFGIPERLDPIVARVRKHP